MIVLTPEDMRKTEQAAFDLGVPSLLLMEHAAIAVVDALEKELGGSCQEKEVLFLCGTGNNGGDGLAAARLFAQRGGRAEIWLTGEPRTQDARTNWNLAQLKAIKMLNLAEIPLEEWPTVDGGHFRSRFDGCVDAILGIGLQGAPTGIAARLIEKIDGRLQPVIAVDVPSGLNAMTGEYPGPSLAADVTVTFHAPKPGLYLNAARGRVGKIVVADIGLRQMDHREMNFPKEMYMSLATPGDLYWLMRRPLAYHKGDCGRVLIYAGSLGMAGAAAMCAQAAIVAGAGLTTIACPREIIPTLQALAPNAMCVDIEGAVENPPAYDVLVMGCGLSRKTGVWEHMMKLYSPDKPCIWDADALNLLADHPMTLGEKTVITPHLGEAARLLSWPLERVKKDRLGAARALSEKYDCITVLKSDVTVICQMQGETPCYILSALGTPALAKGGSGDALAGIMATVMHEIKGMPFRAAGVACAWHGMASQIGEKQFGRREMTTGQLISCLFEAEKWGRQGLEDI